MRPRLLALLLCSLFAVGLSGCGDDDGPSLRERAEQQIDEVRTNVERRVDELKADARRRIDRLRERIREKLGELEKSVPEARETSPRVQGRGRTGEQTIDTFMRDILASVDRYWKRTLRESGQPEPSVNFVAVPPGDEVRSGCGQIAGSAAAFYCPADDTIYIAQEFAAALYQGVLASPSGEGRAAGDFGVAYIVAHEYAHNLQAELDLFRLARDNSSKPFELQADCLAGAWGNSVYKEGLLEEGDIEEAMQTALAVGDFDVSNANHHGTPTERRDAWLLGFRSGEPSRCSRFLPSA